MYLQIDSNNKTGVYKFTNIINNKIYVGSTSQGFYERKNNHLYKLRRNIHENSYLQHSWNKYGEKNFKFKIIEFVAPNECIQREQYWIDALNCCNKNKGYNLKPTAGSSKGYKYTKEQCNNISKGLRTKKAVVQFTINGKLINKFESIKAASKANNIESKVISDVCNNKQNTAGGYRWKFSKDYSGEPLPKLNLHNCSISKYFIEQYDLKYNLLHTWSSLEEIKDKLKFNPNTIKTCLNGYNKTAKGFIWVKKFLNE